jgi:outer membrane receptor protein involved in Fe transport
MPAGRRRRFGRLAGAGSLGIMAFASTAWAQDSSAPATTVPVAAPATDATAPVAQEIVVTGSRIARRDYEANSPIVTANDSLLKQTSSSAIEESLNKLPQFTPTDKNPTQGGDIQPTATNTPGAATVSLRGIGSNRNLVLVDSRRATPSNASMAVDINSIPAAAIDHVEIISGGASATYGADAVGGVVNFILKKNFQGFDLDAQNSISQHGDGYEYTVSGLIGMNSPDGRGNITIGMSTNQRKASYERNRSWYTRLWSDPNVAGSQYFPPYGGVYLGFANLPTTTALNSNIKGATFTTSPAGGTIYSDFSGNAFSGFDSYSTAGTSGFSGADGYSFKNLANGQLGANNTNTYLEFPLKRYNMYMRANYEINDWLSVFAQGTFSQVHTKTVQEPGPLTSGWTVNIDPTINRSVIPSSILAILDSRPDPNAPFQLSGYLPFQRSSISDVTTYNMIAGLDGKIPGTDWTFELYGSHGSSDTNVLQTGFASLQRLEAIITQPNFGAGYTVTGNQGSPNYGFGASTATCTSGLNFFNPSSISQDCLNAIKADIKTRSVMKQTVWEGDFQGSLFHLPAGDVKAAVGLSYRSNDYVFENDTLTTQGESFIEQAVGLYPSGNSSGRITAKELYGELLVPVLSDLPGIKKLELELGGRASKYNTTGTSLTYKAIANWEVTHWLRFRGGYNRAERAPNIAELYLAPQQTFAYAAGGDVCSINNSLKYSANPKANANYQKVIALCGALMERSGNANADSQYYGVDYRTLVAANSSDVAGLVTTAQSSGGSYVFPTLQGNANLKPEKANTWTLGAVIQSPFDSGPFAKLRMSVDFYTIKVNDAIGAQSVDIVQRQCFDPAFNPNYDPNSPYCSGVARTQTGALGNVTQTYYNNGRFRTTGIDVQIDWNYEVGPGRVNFSNVFNYLISMKAAELSTDKMTEYAGTQGPTVDGLDGYAYRWKMLTTLGYTYKGAYLGLQWRHLPSIKSSTAALVSTTSVEGVAESYNLFNLQGSYAVTKDIGIRYGIDNLFNKAPPITGVTTDAVLPALTGGGYDSNNYDTFGRSFYFGVNFKF